MGDALPVRTSGIREPHGEGAGPVIGGVRQRGTVRCPPWFPAFARLVSNLPRLRSIRAYRPDVDDIPSLAREEGDEVARRPSRAEAPICRIRNGCDSAARGIEPNHAVLPPCIPPQAQPPPACT